MKKVRIVSATTKNETDFWQQTLLGQSFNLIPKVNIIDLDFCRQCLERGLRIGTWLISVTHASGGAFGSPSWLDSKTKYFLKWP